MTPQEAFIAKVRELAKSDTNSFENDMDLTTMVMDAFPPDIQAHKATQACIRAAIFIWLEAKKPGSGLPEFTNIVQATYVILEILHKEWNSNG